MSICGATILQTENTVSFYLNRRRGLLRALLLFLLAMPAVLGLSGCASGLMEPVAEELQAEPGEKAVVTFWRFAGSMVKAPVAEALPADDLRLVGILSVNTKLRYAAEPGRHVFVVGGESGSILEAELSPGMHYYVRVAPRWGWFKDRFEMEAVPPEALAEGEVRDQIAGCTLVAPRAEADRWLDENRESMKKKLEIGQKKFIEREDASRYVLPAAYGVRERF